ncbi:MAG: glycosyltransferase family 2 protein [Candidatus Sumerlaeia bacterium]
MRVPKSPPDISIVVANWNGEAFIRRCLETLKISADAAPHACEIIVVDDASEDKSPAIIQSEFPGARLLINAKNLGFGRSCNRGAREAAGRILILANNDLAVPREFVQEIAAPFFADAEEPLFVVGAKTVEMEDSTKPNHLCMYPAWRRGAIGKEWCDPAEQQDFSYAQAGAAAYDREKFLSLGGFQEMFHPGYWEDYEICWRAMRYGWRCLYEPRAVARHVGEGSIVRRYGLGRMERIRERNRLFFVWMNLQDPLLWARHILALPWIYGRDLFQGRGLRLFWGFLMALPRIPRIIGIRRKRRSLRFKTKNKDRQIFKKAQQIHEQ